MTGSDGSALAGDVPGPRGVLRGTALREALWARQAYPAILLRGPVYGVMEQAGSGWLMDSLSQILPQDARDSLGWWFRVLARRRSADAAAREDYWAASALLEQQRLNEMTVADRRFRIVRADQFCRYSRQTGPEPPRASDPDAGPGDPPRPGRRDITHSPLGPAAAPGSAMLIGERWEAIPTGPIVPPEVTREARRALVTHPEIVLLPPRFTSAEEKDGYWKIMAEASPSPSEARRTLALYLEKIVPFKLKPSRQELSAYEQAAQLLNRQPTSQLVVCGRRFRITRVETVVRVGPDGPEPTRPSDYDPNPPLTGETEELRTWDLTDD